jgi:hypothetical protein
MASTISGEIEMNLSQANAQIRSQQAELKKLRSEMRGTQVDADKAGDSLNKQARRARSDLAVFGAQGRVMGQVAQGFTSLAGPVGLVGAAVMGVGVAWNLVTSEIEEATKRAEEFKKSMKAIDDAAVKESAGRAGGAITAAESNIGLGLTYRDPEEYKREAQRKYGFTQEQSGGIMSAVQKQASKIPKENREIFLDSIFRAVQAAELGAGIDPSEAAKKLAADPTAMMRARKGERFSSVAKIASDTYGYRITAEQVEANMSRQLKKPEILEKKRATQLETPRDPIAEDFDMQRKRIENNRKFIEKQLRGGEEVTKFLEKQDKELKDFKLPWYNTTFGEMFSGEQDKSRVEYIRGYNNLRRSQEKEIPKLITRVGEQNPDLSQDEITAIISGLAETIRLNTISNAELKKTIDDNNKKTGENTSATNAVTGIGRQ